MELNNKVSYIKGLVDGLKIDSSTDQGRVILAMLDLMGDMASVIEDLTVMNDELTELVDILDEDLGDLEEDFYQLDSDELTDSELDELYSDDDDDDYEYEDEYEYELECPSCENHLVIDQATLDLGEIHCPNCNEPLEFDFDEDSIEEVVIEEEK